MKKFLSKKMIAAAVLGLAFYSSVSLPATVHAETRRQRVMLTGRRAPGQILLQQVWACLVKLVRGEQHWHVVLPL